MCKHFECNSFAFTETISLKCWINYAGNASERGRKQYGNAMSWKLGWLAGFNVGFKQHLYTGGLLFLSSLLNWYLQTTDLLPPLAPF